MLLRLLAGHRRQVLELADRACFGLPRMSISVNLAGIHIARRIIYERRQYFTEKSAVTSGHLSYACRNGGRRLMSIIDATTSRVESADFRL